MKVIVSFVFKMKKPVSRISMDSTFIDSDMGAVSEQIHRFVESMLDGGWEVVKSEAKEVKDVVLGSDV